MVTIDEILNKCSVEELKFAAVENNLSATGKKDELISRLASSVPAKKALNGLSHKQLQLILGKYGLPKSGTKGEMISRLLSPKSLPKQKSVSAAERPKQAASKAEEKITAHKKGHDFEKQVAAWARRKYKGSTRVDLNAKGLVAVRPHNVDIHLEIIREGIFSSNTDDIWIECKFKGGNKSVKRTEILKLIHDAQDVYKYWQKSNDGIYYNRLMFASNVRFDEDALNYANEFDVLCVQYESGKFVFKNNPEDWLDEPYWLEQVKNA